MGNGQRGHPNKPNSQGNRTQGEGESPIPAVPAYANDHVSKPMPPGHRFELFFPIWKKRSWEMSKTGKSHALKETIKIGAFKAMLDKIVARQSHQASLRGGSLLSFKAESTAPFLTGIGLEHPLENGFSFLKPYGLPYLPGSGVKGVLRKACEEMALSGHSSNKVNFAEVWALFGFEGGSAYLTAKNSGSGSPAHLKEASETMRNAFDKWIASLDQDKVRPLLEPLIEQSTASETEVRAYKNDLRAFLMDIWTRSDLREKIHTRGALVFWDVFPVPPADQLSFDILTPHYSHYYQGGKTPHDSGQPTPNPFITVPKGSTFCFHVQFEPCEGAESLLERWKDIV